MAKILSVSYDPNLLKTREMLLEQMSYSVVSAEGFAEAFKAFRSQQFDLVILCHSIPQADKEAIATEARKASKSPILGLLRPNERPAKGTKCHTSTPDPKEFMAKIKELVPA